MKRFLLVGGIVLALASIVHALPGVKQWRCIWDPNIEADLAGYKVYWRAPGETFDDTRCVDVGNVTECSIMDLGLTPGIVEFAVTAYDTSGNESDFSEVVSHPFDDVAPSAPTNPKME
jgi:hypothetical protein